MHRSGIDTFGRFADDFKASRHAGEPVVSFVRNYHPALRVGVDDSGCLCDVRRAGRHQVIAAQHGVDTFAGDVTTVKRSLGLGLTSPNLLHSPVSLKDLELLKKTVLFSEEDAKYLRMSHDVLKDQTDAVLAWYAFVGSTRSFLTKKGTSRRRSNSCTRPGSRLSSSK